MSPELARTRLKILVLLISSTRCFFYREKYSTPLTGAMPFVDDRYKFAAETSDF